jgi:hypothetical protein
MAPQFRIVRVVVRRDGIGVTHYFIPPVLSLLVAGAECSGDRQVKYSIDIALTEQLALNTISLAIFYLTVFLA